MLPRMCNLYTSNVTGAEIARAFNAHEPAFDFTGDEDHYPNHGHQSSARRVKAVSSI
jgi:hypothetical protein